MKLKHCFQRAAAVIACLMLLCSTVYAAETTRPSYTPLTEAQLGKKDCTLTIIYEENGTPLPETTFKLYKVANLKENLHFGLVAPFDNSSQYPVNWNFNNAGYSHEDWMKLAATLSGLVVQNDLKPTAIVKTNNEGKATFTNLETGLYLMTGNSTHFDGHNYTPAPAMIALPFWNNGSWNFNPESTVKKTIDEGTNTLRAIKEWNDAGYENRRPTSITFHLIENGTVIDTVTLTAANGWEGHTWENLDTKASYTVSEEPVSGYTTSIQRTGLTCVVTNTVTTGGGGGGGGGTPTPPGPGPNPTNPTDPTPPEVNIDPTEPPRAEIDVEDPQTPLGVIDPPPAEEVSIGEDPVPQGQKNLVDVEDPAVPLAIKLPQTGQLWWPVPVLAAAGVLLIAAGMKRRQSESNCT